MKEKRREQKGKTRKKGYADFSVEPKKHRKKQALLFLIGLIIIFMIPYKLGIFSLGRDAESLVKLIAPEDAKSLFFLVAIAMLASLMLCLRALRLIILLRSTGINAKKLSCLKVSAISYFISSITPSRVGEFIKIAFFRNKLKAIAVSLVEYLSDIVAVVLLPIAFIGLSIIAGSGKELAGTSASKAIVAGIAIIAAIFAFLAIAIKTSFVEKIAASFAMKRFLSGKIKRYARNKEELSLLFLTLTRKRYFSSMAIASANYIVYFFIAWLLFIKAGINIPFIAVGAALAVSQLIGAVTFIPLGLGTKELSAVAYLSAIGYNATGCFIVMLGLRIITLIPVGIGYAFYLLSLKQTKEQMQI